MRIARSQSISLALHFVSVALLLVLTSQSFRTPPPPVTPNLARAVPLAPPRLLVHVVERPGGGSNTTSAPARHGMPPPRSYRTFVAPVSQPDPKLALNQGIDFDVPVVAVSASDFGDPFSKLGGIGLGLERGHTIGNHSQGPGIGDKDGVKGVGRFGMAMKPAE